LSMADFSPSFEAVLLNEGGYKLTTVQNDKGGQTYAGITRRSNPNWLGWAAIDAGGRPEAQLVRDLYRGKYWDAVRGDELPQKVAASLFDFAVNAGAKTAVKLAQLVVGVTPDGEIGPVTLKALNSVSPEVFVSQFAVAKIARYRDICMKDRSQSKFLLGWINRALLGVA